MQRETHGDQLFACYANLAMAHAAVSEGASRYATRHYMVRSRLYAGLRKGSMSVRSLAADERLKMVLPQACAYCGSRDKLSIDHVVPRKRGGADHGENLVWACRACNSSKGTKDALEWLAERGRFPPLLLLRRYLKLAIAHFRENGLLETTLECSVQTPFSLHALPRKFPPPHELTLWVVPLDAEGP